MHEYAITQTHTEEELTLLCSKHHSEKTRGLLPRAAVLEANELPFNVKKGISEPYGLHFSSSRREIVIGGNKFTTQSARISPLMIYDEEVIVFDSSQGCLLLSGSIRNDKGHQVLAISDNEITYSVDSWDIEFVGKTLTLRNASHDLSFRATFEPPSRVVITRANLRYKNVHVTVDSKGLQIEGLGPRMNWKDCNIDGDFKSAFVLASEPGKHGALKF